VPESVRTDADIRTWRQYLSPRRKTGAKVTGYCRQVEGWNEQAAMAGLLEALLLSEATYDQIAMELGGLDPEVVRFYQSSFFNVRDNNGALVDNLSLHARFDQDQQAGPNVQARATWQRAGLSGFKTLASLLRPTHTAGTKDDPIDQLIRQELLRRVLTRQLGSRELILLQQTKMEIERTKAEMAKTAGQDNEGWVLARKMLEMVRPQVAIGQQHNEENQRALRNVKATEASIRATQVADSGMEGRISKLGTDRTQVPKN
jgi:hypothetical protein